METLENWLRCVGQKLPYIKVSTPCFDEAYSSADWFPLGIDAYIYSTTGSFVQNFILFHNHLCARQASDTQSAVLSSQLV